MTEHSTLESRAAEFERTVETYLVDGDALVLSLIDIDTMKVFPEDYFDDRMDIFRYPGAQYRSFGDFLAYENVGMVTGAYLAAQVWKHRATGESAALDKARRCFAALRELYQRSQSVAQGFLSKCYDSEISDQTSSDQYIYVMNALDLYAPLASASDRRTCSQMIGEMARFWIDRQYQYPYFGKPLNWPVDRFPVFAYLAYRHTGDRVFMEEFNQLHDMPAAREGLPFGISWEANLQDARTRPPAFEFEHGSDKRLIRYHAEAMGSGYISLSALLEYDAPYHELWLTKAAKLYESGRMAIGTDGLARGPGLLRLDTGEIEEVRKRLHDGSDHPHWHFLRFVGRIQSGMTAAMFARGAVGLHAWLPDLGALAEAMRVLRGIDHNKLRWRIDADGQQFPQRMAWAGHVFSGDAVTNWLWAYWEARARFGDLSDYDAHRDQMPSPHGQDLSSAS